MLCPLVRALTLLLAVPSTSACTQLNPLFDISATAQDTGSTTTNAPDPTTADFNTQDPVTSDTSGTTSTSDIDPLTTTLGETDVGDTSTGQADTGDVPLEPVTVVASLATCVLLTIDQLGYVGPAACETLAEEEDKRGQMGVMILDTAFNGGGEGRPAQVFLRFEIPATPPGTVLTGATLSVQASTSGEGGGPSSGDLYKVSPFDAESLKVGAPVGVKLTADPGPAVSGKPSIWPIEGQQITPEQPLFLGLVALDSNGVLYRSTRAGDDLKPRLQLTYQ